MPETDRSRSETCIAFKSRRCLPLSVDGTGTPGTGNTRFSTPVCPIYQNVDAQPYTDPAKIQENLIAQLTASVRWTQIMKNMIADGATSFLEIGPGKVLQGLLKKVSTEIETNGIQ